MASEMAEEALRQFKNWVKSASRDELVTLNQAFFSWLREEGMATVGEQYGIAVETLLLAATNCVDMFPQLARPSDDGAWDYMTEAGFRFEQYLWAHKKSKLTRPGID